MFGFPVPVLVGNMSFATHNQCGRSIHASERAFYDGRNDRDRAELSLPFDPALCHAPRQDKETLLSQRGQAKGRLHELTSLCERQRAQLAEAKVRLTELERLASAGKEDTRLAEDQVRCMKAYIGDGRDRHGLRARVLVSIPYDIRSDVRPTKAWCGVCGVLAPR